VFTAAALSIGIKRKMEIAILRGRGLPGRDRQSCGNRHLGRAGMAETGC
jgi:hypothetical protein